MSISILASSRRSFSWVATRKTARKKIKKSAARGSEKTPVVVPGIPGSGILSDWSTLEHYGCRWNMRDGGGRTLSTSDAVLKPVIYNKLKDFPHMECLREEEKKCIKIWLMEDDIAILTTGLWKSLKSFNSFHEEIWKLSAHFGGKKGTAKCTHAAQLNTVETYVLYPLYTKQISLFDVTLTRLTASNSSIFVYHFE